MTTKLIKALALTLSLCTYGCSATQYKQNTVTIMDHGFHIPAQTYTVIPEGYQISGYKTSDPSRGFGGDRFELIAGADGRRKIIGAQIMMANGDINLLIRCASQSIQTALQRAQESGNLTSQWQQVSASIPGMSSLQAEFATPDGRVGLINFVYQASGDSATGFPIITFSRPQDINQFIQELNAIDQGIQNNPQWSVRQQQAAQNGLRQLYSDHQNKMISEKAALDRSQPDPIDLIGQLDGTNKQWRETFNSGGSTQSPGNECRLDAGYYDTYTNGQGDYYQTDGDFFEPAQDDWEEIDNSLGVR